jgi:hypothetical protein
VAFGAPRKRGAFLRADAYEAISSSRTTPVPARQGSAGIAGNFTRLK